MITVPLINWQSMGAMPEDRKDGRQILFAFQYENGTVNPGPPHWLYSTGRFTSGRWWFEEDHGYSLSPNDPQRWADINAPE